MKNEIVTISALAAMIMVSCCSFASNTVETQTRNVQNFNAIDVAQGINVNIDFGDAESAIVKANPEFIDEVVTEVKSGVLYIYLKNKTKIKKVTYTVDVTAMQIDAINASSGAQVNSKCIKNNNVKLNASSGATINAEMKAEKTSLKTTSGSTIRVNGSADVADVVLNSGSSIDASSLCAKNMDINVSSGASAYINVKDSLQAEASSGASIRYFGNPHYRVINKSSGGSVSQR